MHIPRLRAPIVMVHGLWGYDELRLGPWRLDEYFSGLPEPLRQAGNRVLIPRLSPAHGTARRAQDLQTFIERHIPNEPLHIIAHSMGGLDSRYLISRLGMADRVLSLTTIGTPHRGSPVADVGIRYLAAVLRPLLDTIRMPYEAYFNLTTDFCREFNKATPNAPNVRYFSVAGLCVGPWRTLPWLPAQQIVESAEGPSDGIVSVSSATWGEHVDVWASDHLNLINWPNRRAMRRGQWVDRVILYGNLLRKLADAGF